MSELAAYAASDANSLGRLYPEPAPTCRTQMQRDRDRIIHSSAFRRLEYKTQVFVNHEGDMFRTRLTHSLEVAQIARTIARAMQLNEDLTEAVALAHDLGHTPFGHAGQDALNDCMREFGGFEHNLQSLRVVDTLEEKYAEFPGLNLTFETREGILKHCARSKARALGEIGKRFLEGGQPSLEAQLTNLADEIAYNNHDVDDGLRAGLISIEQLQEVGIIRRQYEAVMQRWPDINGRRLIHELARSLINELVLDMIETSRKNIAEYAPVDIHAVRESEKPLMQFSPNIHRESNELKQFLRKNMYRHTRVYRMTAKASRILRALFEAFVQDHRLLPEEFHQKVEDCGGDEPGSARIIADYIAGMTDRYAITEHKRIFSPDHLT